MRLIILIATIFVCTREFGACYSLDDGIQDFEDFENFDVQNFVCNDANLTLNFTGTEFSEMTEGFIASPLITCLNFERNNIIRVSEGAFKHVPNLQHLNLAYNRIEPSNLFRFGGHTKLRSLILKEQRDQYYNYKISITEPYPYLEYLDLSGIKIQSLSAAFDNDFMLYFPRLKYLDLSNNQLSDHVIKKLSKSSLRYLYLQGNQIRSVSSASYPELVELALDNNKIVATDWPGLFYSVEFPKLRNLTLSNNQIPTISPYSFASTPLLEYLDFSNNALSTINYGSFNNLKYLRSLSLDGNKLGSLSFINEPLNITSLSVRCNNIEILTNDTFGNLPFLTELYLDNNWISRIDADTFVSQTSLTALHLSGNMLSSLPEGWSSALLDLKYLDLSFNKFISLEALALSPGINLPDLHLANHTLKYLNSHSFENLPSNLHIDLEPMNTRPFDNCNRKDVYY